MRLHRFIGEYNLNNKIIEILDKETIKQIKDVLRLKNKDKLVLCDGKEKEAQVEIREITKNKIMVSIIEVKDKKDINKKVSLYLAILKKENFELALQKVVEIGVSEIIPIITERTIKTNLNFNRLEKIIAEASEQSGRTIIPKLYPILKFKDAILDGKKNEGKIFFDLNEEINTKGGGNASALNSSIFIGPEGGFTENENTYAKENGYEISSLGQFTLRAETATIVAVYKTINS